jgi:aryl-alcohol dehydrogenase-like predicted oxidoreductase
MQYRTLGQTGLKVSEIGFGCGNIGGLMIRAPLTERLAAVDKAVEMGINYFDTAAAYGNGRSEENLGEVLSLRKLKVVVATKFSLSREDLDDIEGAIRRSLEASLRRLRRDSVDIFQLHAPVFGGNNVSSRGIDLKFVLGPQGIADALDKLRSERLFRFMGFTGLGDTAALHEVVQSGRFDLLQIYYNLLNPSATIPVSSGFTGQNFDGLMTEAARRNLGVAAIRVLAGGALGGPVARTGYAAPSVGGALVSGGEYALDLKRGSKLKFLLKGEVSRLSQAAIRFVLGQPEVSTALVGFSNLQQIEEAAECSDQGPLPESDLEQLQELWSSNFGL